MGKSGYDSGGGGMNDFALGIAIVTMLLGIVAITKYIGGFK